MTKRIGSLFSAFTLLAAVLLVFPARPASAVTITSAGPLNNITISPTLNCSVNHLGDTHGEWFGETACGTFIDIAGTNYGPANVPANGYREQFWTPIGQSPLTGTGTSADPFTIITVVQATPNITLTQTDTYVIGDEFYSTSATVSNSAASPQAGIIYTAGDCYLQDSDSGYGHISGNSAVCTTDPGVGGRIQSLIPITGGNHWEEAGYSTIWSRIGAGIHFQNTCVCNSRIDNGAGLSWDMNVPASSNQTFQWLTVFSPTGITPLQINAVADSPSTAVNTDDGYTITILNSNTASATANNLSITLPPDFTFIPGSVTGYTTADPVISGQTLTWPGSVNINPDGTVTLHFGVNVGDTPGVFTIDATAGAIGTTVVPAIGTAAINVLPVADLSITDSVSPTSVVAGNAITYTLTATNNGASIAPGVTVTQQLPPGFSLAPSANCVSSGTQVICTAPGVLGVGDSQVFTVNVNVGSSVAPGSYADFSSVSFAGIDPVSTNNSASSSVTVSRQINLGVTKQFSPASPVAGGPITYTFTVSNTGPSDASNVTLVDSGASNFTPNSVNLTACNVSSGTLHCTWPTLGAGQSFTVIVSGILDASTVEGTLVTDTAIVDATETDTNPANNTATATATSVEQSDVSIQKSPVSSAFVAGKTASYGITVINNGPSLARNVVVTDTLPSGVTFVPTLSASECTGTTMLTCDLGDMLPGGTHTRELAIAVSIPSSTPAGTQLVNDVEVTADNDIDPANNTDSAPSTITHVADLQITKFVPSSPLVAGGPGTYEIEVLNIGPSDAETVTITDILPAGFVFTSINGPACTGTVVITCNLDSLAALDTVTVEITGVVPDVAINTPIDNLVQVTSADPDPNIDNNTFTLTEVPAIDTALSVSKSTESTLTAGTSASYVLSINNGGPSTATSLVLTDTLPEGLTVTNATTAQGTCSFDTTSISCSLASLAGSLSWEVVIDMDVDPSLAAGAILDNEASVTSDQQTAIGDTSTLVTRSTDFEVSKSLVGSAVAGQNAVWQILVTNNGPSDSTGFFLSDRVTVAHASITSITGDSITCSIVGAAADCTTGSLPSGDTAVFTVTAHVSESAIGDLGNSVEIDPFDQGETVTDTTTDPIDQQVVLNLEKTSLSESVPQGQAVGFILKVTNNGPSTATGVAFSDTLPAGFTFNATQSTPGCIAGVGQAVDCTLSQAISVNGSASVTIVATPETIGSFSNTATVTSDGGGTDQDDAPIEVLPTANLTITKTPSTSNVLAGQSLFYTVTITNNGPSTATNLVVNDILPTKSVFLPGPGAPVNCNIVLLSISCTLASLANGDSESFIVPLAIAPDYLPVGTTIASLANAVAVTSDTFDDDPSDNASTTAIAINRFADLEVLKSAVPEPVLAGNKVTYTVTVNNRGPSVADAFLLNDALPFGVHFTPDGSDPSCVLATSDDTGDRVTCASASPLDVLGVHNFTVAAIVDGGLGAGSQLLNQAIVNAVNNSPGQTSLDNQAQATTTVDTLFDVGVLISINPSTVNAGESAELVITLTNSGPSTAKDVVATFELPEGIEIAPPSKGSADCETSERTVTCFIPALVAGDAPVAIRTVLTSNPGQFPFNVSITTPGDTNPANDAASATLTVVAAPVEPATPSAVASTEVLGAQVTRGGRLAFSGYSTLPYVFFAAGMLFIGLATVGLAGIRRGRSEG